MSKLLGVAGLAASLLFAIACGSNDLDPVAGTVSYKGTIDSGLIASADLVDYTVNAIDSDGNVAGTDTTIDAVAGYDHEFMVDSLTAGTYTFNVMKGDAVLVSTVGEASSSSGSLSASKYTSPNQINIYTHMVALVFADSTVTDLATAIKSVFGSSASATDLSKVAVEGATLTPPEGALPDDVVNAKAAAITISATVQAIVQTPKTSLTTGSAFLEAITTLVDDFTIAATSSADGIATTVINEISGFGGDLANAFSGANPSVTYTYDFSVVDAAYSAVTVSNMSTEVSSVATAVKSAASVTSFGLADSSLGTKSLHNFKVYTLAPTFTAVVEGDFSSNTVSELLTLSFTKGSTTVTGTEAIADSLISYTKTYLDPNTTITIQVNGGDALTASGLEPGTTYGYAVTAKNNALKFDGGTSLSGTLTTSAITITGKDLLTGVSADALELYVHSSEAVSLSNATDGGIVTRLTVSGTPGSGLTGSYATEDFDVTLNSSGNTSAKLTPSTSIQSLLVPGTTYTIAPTLSITKEGTSTLITDYASTLEVTIK